MFIKNSNFIDSNTHSIDLPTTTTKTVALALLFPTVTSEVRKGEKAKYAFRGELLSQQMDLIQKSVFPHILLAGHCLATQMWREWRQEEESHAPRRYLSE